MADQWDHVMPRINKQQILKYWTLKSLGQNGKYASPLLRIDILDISAGAVTPGPPARSAQRWIKSCHQWDEPLLPPVREQRLATKLDYSLPGPSAHLNTNLRSWRTTCRTARIDGDEAIAVCPAWTTWAGGAVGQKTHRLPVLETGPQSANRGVFWHLHQSNLAASAPPAGQENSFCNSPEKKINNFKKIYILHIRCVPELSILYSMCQTWASYNQNH